MLRKEAHFVECMPLTLTVNGNVISDFSHLVGESLSITIDGVVYEDQVVEDDGTIIVT